METENYFFRFAVLCLFCHLQRKAVKAREISVESSTFEEEFKKVDAKRSGSRKNRKALIFFNSLNSQRANSRYDSRFLHGVMLASHK